MHLLENGLVKTDQAADSLRRNVQRLELERDTAIAALEDERKNSAALARSLVSLRNILAPLYNGLRVIFGELEAAGPTGSPEPTGGHDGPLDASRYAPWKQKYPGQTAVAIDILVKYEAGLTRKQLAGYLGIDSGSGSMSQVIFKLNKAELIVKDGTTIRLKRL